MRDDRRAALNRRRHGPTNAIATLRILAPAMVAMVLAASSRVCGAAAAASPVHLRTSGLTPLEDLGTGTYLGFEGGLYAGGANVPPAQHLAAALQKAGQVVPRNAAGAPDPNGWIVMVAIGMSNTTHEFGAFERLEDADTGRNAHVILMDTALGGQTAATIANPAAGYWTVLQQRLTAMGLTAAQVQVAWLKEADAQPANNFPVHAQTLRDELRTIAGNLHDKFANLQLCYLSSRIYGGYAAQGSLNPEPQAYESGFAAKWLIQNQIDGDVNLNYGQLPGAVRAPLLLWGPYLWADGTNPRSDGLVWLQTDLEGDATHPSPSGEQKVAGLLTAFFAADPTAAAWWPAQPGTALVTLDALHDTYVSAAASSTNFGAALALLEQGGAAPIRTYLRFDLGGITAPVLLAKLSLRVTTTDVGGGTVALVSDTQWTENAVTWNTAPALGLPLVQMPQSSRDGTIAANVTPTVQNDPDRQVAFALTTPAAGLGGYHSKEDGQPPRLVLVVESAPTDAAVPTAGAMTLELQRGLPNPFNPATSLVYTLPTGGRALLTVHDVQGHRIATLVNALQNPGSHRAAWDGRGTDGAMLASGVYLVRLAFNGNTRTKKIVLAR